MSNGWSVGRKVSVPRGAPGPAPPGRAGEPTCQVRAGSHSARFSRPRRRCEAVVVRRWRRGGDVGTSASGMRGMKGPKGVGGVVAQRLRAMTQRVLLRRQITAMSDKKKRRCQAEGRGTVAETAVRGRAGWSAACYLLHTSCAVQQKTHPQVHRSRTRHNCSAMLGRPFSDGVLPPSRRSRA